MQKKCFLEMFTYKGIFVQRLFTEEYVCLANAIFEIIEPLFMLNGSVAPFFSKKLFEIIIPLCPYLNLLFKNEACENTTTSLTLPLPGVFLGENRMIFTGCL
jgi:hypothetical protein